MEEKSDSITVLMVERENQEAGQESALQDVQRQGNSWSPRSSWEARSPDDIFILPQ